ncbi:hypothetical protein K3727_15745 [Rhodobacteraceae bacterium M382]|nr:hypothetical protein K3727_15745 [Rhodobacteraceae bacterium M382]
MKTCILTSVALTVAFSSPVFADWRFSAGPSPMAFVQAGQSTLELGCDRIRFAPAGDKTTQDIAAKQGLSLRFLTAGAVEIAAFQVGQDNADLRVGDGNVVDIVLWDKADQAFVMDQMAAHMSVNLSGQETEMSYGLFDLNGSGAAIKSLRSACDDSPQETVAYEAPEGVVYCGGGGVKRQIEYLILANPVDDWDARVTVNGETTKAMTAYSYFGNAQPPQGFVVALLGQDRSEFLIFQDGGDHWLEFGDYRYDQCN